jgi:hypothetical protein
MTQIRNTLVPTPCAAAGTVVCPSQGISLRRIPYPYRAILAICSDLDETPDRDVYWEITRFLNTTESTPMGVGLGLEVGNSIYFDMPPGQFSYWSMDDAGRAMTRALIQSGHIDCLHSFGDLAQTRAHAGRALDELARHDCRIAVWTDHAVAPSNFGADIMRGYGDVPGHPAYHADLTWEFGVRYVWRGRVTSVLGQDTRRSLRGIYDRSHPVASAKTLGKEAVKGVLARWGSSKYRMHGANRLLRPSTLRSGHEVFEFIRSNPHRGGVSRGETAEGLAQVLREDALSRLVEAGGVCVLYTHLGKIQRVDEPLGPPTRKALALLAQYSHAGKILVTTTRRLLGYCQTVPSVTLLSRIDGDYLAIDVTTWHREVDSRNLVPEIRGLTVYVSDPARTRITINQREITNFRRNGPDHTGQRSVSVPWDPLEFPKL